jgi:tetratricopeptide (TPR) repeat protein
LRASARIGIVDMLLRDGKPAAALAQAELALVDSRGRQNEFRTLQLEAVAQAALGRTADSAKTLTLLEDRAKVLPGQAEMRRVKWTRGQIALLAGDSASAAKELNEAVAMLPIQGPPTGPPSSHADLRFDAAMTNVKVGNDAEAARLLERIQSGYEWTFGSETWARSFFLLGQIYERRGDKAKARDQYAQFLTLWRDGDLERGWVAEAAKKTASAESAK